MIRFLVMDVDGTLTDGKIYMGESGEVCKAFNIKDGCGVKELLPLANGGSGIIPIVITARESKIVRNRCEELDISLLYMNVADKKKLLDNILKEQSLLQKEQFNYANVAYIGDDLRDIPCMKAVKAGNGLIGAPQDACREILEMADFISQYRGGEGAVRDFIEWIL